MNDSDLLVRLNLWYAGRCWTRPTKLFARYHPKIKSLLQMADCWQLETVDGTFFLSEPSQLVRFVGIGTDMTSRVFEKYRYPGFVSAQTGDTVLDVGAFIGEFSMRVAERAEELVAVEPDKRNVAALRSNLGAYDHADVLNQAMWRESGCLDFNVASDPSEGSLLDVDATGTDTKQTITAGTVKGIASEYDWDEIDFLKIEAEGAEPEVLEGIEDIQVNKIAVECSAERDGSPPTDDVLAYLSERDYTIRMKDSVIFGRRTTL